MLKCKAVAAGETGSGLFRILDDDEGPASAEDLERVARVANLLLRENALAGTFRASGPGLLALDLPGEEPTFFHNGIVFAALDAFNDPIKNPTLTLFADDETS